MTNTQDKMIRKFIDEYSDELSENETIRINHDGCPAGTDTRRRLYITKKPQVILGYCHNCQQSAARYIAAKDRFKPYHGRVSKEKTETDKVFAYPCTEKIDSHSPAEVTIWRQKNGLSMRECEDYNIKYVADEHAIYTPIRTMQHSFVDLNGYQLRPLTNEGAKYITHLKDETVPLGGLLRHKDAKGTVVVEDYISAVSIHRCKYTDAFLAMNVVCNYGVQIKPEILSQLPDDKPVYIWLDNDSPHVKKKARDMQAVCQLLGFDTYLVTRTEEPKHISSVEIQRTLSIEEAT